MNFNLDDYLNDFYCFKKTDVIACLGTEAVKSLSNIKDGMKNNTKYKDKQYVCVPMDSEYSDKVIDMIKSDVDRKIVAFVGRAGSGKDYQCNLLVENQGFKKLAFADALRDIALTILDLNEENALEHYDTMKSSQNCIEVKVEDRGVLYQHNNLSFRRFLELLGTQGIRKYDNDFWCRCLIKTIKDNNYKKVCISDMRFLNEYEYLSNFAKENGYEFNVYFCDYHSARYEEDNNHESAMMGNYFAKHDYEDLAELNVFDFKDYKESINF